VPADAGTADRVIHSIEPNVSDDLLEWVKNERVKATDALTSAIPPDAELKCHLNDTLYPYQRAFVHMAATEKAILNADDMGLGKTIQALGMVAEYQARHQVSDGVSTVIPNGPKLIVCPNSVKGVWAREIVKWLGSDEPHQIIDGSSAKTRHKQLVNAIKEEAFAIVNYEQLRVTKAKLKVNHRGGGSSTRSIEIMKQPLFELPFLAQVDPDFESIDPRTIERARTSKHRKNWFFVVGDEIHRAKNRRASQTKGLYRTQGDLKLAQTGTPIMNTPDELWSILHWLYPEQYTSYWDFYETYVDYTEGYFGKVITGVRNPDALRFELTGRLVRRTKDQVLDLPEKTRVIVPVTLSAAERQFYNEVESQVWIDLVNDANNGDDVLAKALESGDLGNLLKVPNGAARIVRLQQALEHPANINAERALVSAKMDACEEIILDNKHEQHVVFLKFKQSVTMFAERLREKGLKVATYTGDTPTAVRTSLEDQFQRGELDVMVGTLDAMREGITLTAASICHFPTRAWVPGWNEQAEDRLHRNGQRDPVTIYIYEAVGTVDDGKVRPANALKETIVGTVLVKDEVKETRHQ
jgi:SWI/SNF-related matrix-associated actin-dependent regulator 1 of chromatin subfamily A